MSENGRNKDYYAGKQAGVFQERERIIKLLQKEAVFCMLEKHVEDYVALIKGEGECQKDNETVVLLTEEAVTQRVALAWERERFDRLWQIEMGCKCEEAMQHLKVRMGRTQSGIDYDAEFGDNE